jgi:hypothetical protein
MAIPRNIVRTDSCKTNFILKDVVTIIKKKEAVSKEGGPF